MRDVNNIAAEGRTRRFRRVPWPPLIGMAFLVFLGAIAVQAPWLAPANPQQQSLANALTSPFSSAEGTFHILGTDELGRDLLSRLMFGTRQVLVTTIASVVLATFVGSVIGMLGGLWRGWVDLFLARLTDVQLALPPLILAVILAVAIGAGTRSVVVAIALATWPQFARVVRAETLRVSKADYVLLARVAGMSQRQIGVRHVAPNIVNVVVVLISLNLSVALILSAALSFLGVGVQAPRPDWGNMLAGGVQYLSSAPWLVLVPGITVSLAVLSLSLVGDHVRDVLDPRTGVDLV